MTNPNDALDALDRIERTLHHFASGLDGLDDGGYTDDFSAIETIRAALTQKPVIEGLDYAIKQALAYMNDEKNSLSYQEMDILLSAARAYQQGHTPPQESVDLDELRERADLFPSEVKHGWNMAIDHLAATHNITKKGG